MNLDPAHLTLLDLRKEVNEVAKIAAPAHGCVHVCVHASIGVYMYMSTCVHVHVCTWCVHDVCT